MTEGFLYIPQASATPKIPPIAMPIIIFPNAVLKEVPSEIPTPLAMARSSQIGTFFLSSFISLATIPVIHAHRFHFRKFSVINIVGYVIPI